MTTTIQACDICGLAAANVCGKCRAVAYCSSGCQRSGWPQHRLLCGTPQEVTSRVQAAVDTLHLKIRTNLLVMAAVAPVASDIEVVISETPLNFCSRNTVDTVDIVLLGPTASDDGVDVQVFYCFPGAKYRKTVTRLPLELIPKKYTTVPRDKWTIFVD